MNNSTKSAVLLSLIRNNPRIVSKETVKDFTTNYENPILSYEDAAEAISIIPNTKEDEKRLSKKIAENMFDRIFPNSRLEAELEICKDIDREKYQDFTDTVFKLNEIVSSIEKEYGGELDFLLDEMYQVGDKSTIDKIKNMKTTIIDIENSYK